LSDSKPTHRVLVIYAVAALVVFNIFVMGGALAILSQSTFYSAGRFTFIYDETKLVIKNVGNFQYDDSGNLDKLQITIENKDSNTAYSGILQVSISEQSYDITIAPLDPEESRKYTIDLNPNLPRSSVISVDATVFTSAGGNNGEGTGAIADLEAIKGAAIADSAIDGTIGTEWNDAKHYTSIPIDPSGSAEIWVKNDGTNLYFAIKFTADSSNPWVAFQLGTKGCMDSSADLPIFGNDHLVASGYSDAYYDSSDSAKADTTQNGKGAMNVGTGNVVAIELKKPLNSGDVAGKDIAWSAGNTYFLVIAWDSNGGGSSGGSVNHKSGTSPTPRSILIGA